MSTVPYVIAALVMVFWVLINSPGNISGFAAPYTSSLRDLTGTQRTGLWVVGACKVAGALVALALGAKPRKSVAPDGDHSGASQ